MLALYQKWIPNNRRDYTHRYLPLTSLGTSPHRCHVSYAHDTFLIPADVPLLKIVSNFYAFQDSAPQEMLDIDVTCVWRFKTSWSWVSRGAWQSFPRALPVQSKAKSTRPRSRTQLALHRYPIRGFQTACKGDSYLQGKINEQGRYAITPTSPGWQNVPEDRGWQGLVRMGLSYRKH